MLPRPTWSSGWKGAVASVLVATFAPAALAEPKDEWVSHAVLKDQKGYGWVLAFSPDGKTLAATCGGYDLQPKKKVPVSLRLWDVETQKVTRTLYKDGSDIIAMAFTPDGKQIVAACFDGHFRRLDVDSGKEVDSITLGDRLSTVWFSPDRKLVLLPTTKEKKAGQPPPPTEYQLLEVETGKKVEPAKPIPTTAPILALAPEAKTLAVNVSLPPDPRVKLPPGVSFPGGRQEAHLWDAATGKNSEPLTKQLVSQALFSPDGNLLLLVCYDGPSGKKSLHFWDVADKKMRAGNIPYTKELRNFAFNGGGTLVAATCDDNTIRLWETTKMKEVAALKGHTAPAQAITFAPDGYTLATAETNGTIRLWRRKGP
jgi:WD40 repeat protein